MRIDGHFVYSGLGKRDKNSTTNKMTNSFLMIFCIRLKSLKRHRPTRLLQFPFRKRQALLLIHFVVHSFLTAHFTFIFPLIQDSRMEEKLQREKEKLHAQVEALKKASQVGSRRFFPSKKQSFALIKRLYDSAPREADPICLPPIKIQLSIIKFY